MPKTEKQKRQQRREYQRLRLHAPTTRCHWDTPLFWKVACYGCQIRAAVREGFWDVHLRQAHKHALMLIEKRGTQHIWKALRYVTRKYGVELEAEVGLGSL